MLLADVDSDDDSLIHSSEDEEVPITPVSQQDIIELLVLSVQGHENFKDDKGNFLNFEEWEGVECTETGYVRQLRWNKSFPRSKDSEHRINLEWIPSTVWNFEIAENDLDGSLSMVDMPRPLYKLRLSKNKLSSTVDLSKCPAKLVFLHLDRNHFFGSADLTRLPVTLEKINLSHNNFSGSIDITLFPSKMGHVYLNHNNFSGTIHVSRLNVSYLRVLMLNDNALSGELHFFKFPKLIEYMSFANNKFTNFYIVMLDVWILPFLRGIDLRGTGIRCIVDAINCSEIQTPNIFLD